MSVIATLKMVLKFKDISTSAYVASGDNSRSWDGGDLELTLKSDSTPDAEGDAVVLVTLTAGAATVDLTALANLDGDTRTAAGKKIRGFLFYNPSTALITVSKGASNGHAPLSTTFVRHVAPNGGVDMAYMPDATAITNSSNDTLDFAGTGTDTILMKVLWG